MSDKLISALMAFAEEPLAAPPADTDCLAELLGTFGEPPWESFDWQDKGAKSGGKEHAWVGTGADKGKSRTQISKPGSRKKGAAATPTATPAVLPTPTGKAQSPRNQTKKEKRQRSREWSAANKPQKLGIAYRTFKAEVSRNVDMLPLKLGVAVKAVYHTMQIPYAQAQNAALAIARERRLNDNQTTRLTVALGVCDFLAMRALAGIPYVTPGLLKVAGFGLVGTWIGSLVPVASTAYLGYCAVKHGPATLRAAGKAIKSVWERFKSKKKATTHAEDDSTPEWLHTFIDRVATNDEVEQNRYLALFAVATDYVKGDMEQAVELAEMAWDEMGVEREV